MAAFPVYGTNASGTAIVLLDALLLNMPQEGAYTWQTIVGLNPTLLQLVKTKGGKTTVVIKDNVVNDNGKNYYFGLYGGENAYHVDATKQFKSIYDYHFYQLKSTIRNSDVLVQQVQEAPVESFNP